MCGVGRGVREEGLIEARLAELEGGEEEWKALVIAVHLNDLGTT